MIDIDSVVDLVVNIKVKLSTISYFLQILEERKEDIEEYISEKTKNDVLTDEDKKELCLAEEEATLVSNYIFDIKGAIERFKSLDLNFSIGVDN